MRRIHKGCFYKQKVKGEVVVISTEDIERTSYTKYMFSGVILIDSLNPERIGTTTVCHAHGVSKIELDIQISKTK